MQTFVDIDHEIIYSHSPPSADSRRAVISYKQKYEVLVIGLVKLAEEKVWLGELIDRHDYIC